MLKGVFVQNRANLSIRSNVKLDQTAEDLVRLSYEYLQGRRFPFLWAPVPMTDLSCCEKLFPDTSLQFAEVAICVHCSIAFHSVPKRKTPVSIFLISSHYTAENSNKLHTHTLLQSSLLQAKQTHLWASLCTLCALALWPSWCPSAGFCPVCQCLSCPGEPKPKTQHSKHGLTSAELTTINHWFHAWYFLSGREGHIPEDCLDCVFRMNTGNEGIVSVALVDQKPVNEMLKARKSSSKC